MSSWTGPKEIPIPIGTRVDVNKIIVRSYEKLKDGKRRKLIAIKTCSKWSGFVTGAKYIRKGVVEEKSGYRFVPEGKATLVFLVRKGYINKEIEVPANGLKIADDQSVRMFFYWNDDTQSSENKRVMTEEVRYFPRDEKGKFAKYPDLIDNNVVLNHKGMFDKNSMQTTQNKADEQKTRATEAALYY
jgi:hypothetical protein